MDEIDRKLVTLLRADARAPVARLARAVNLSRGAVQNRIDKMLAAGAIAGFTLRSPTVAEAARVRAIMGIAVEGERSAAVLRALRGLPEVEAVHTTNGRWDMIAELFTDSLAGFSNALDNIRLIDGISATETSLLLKTHRM
ncbi:MAG TPA: Lrp/AsnC family transcriptional regulator [Caulobacteraceae bacterium]|jgi:DNA-binding Lrp family transcriptional regulator|nr:Lrp/AsnC family transcriptional regulator [Caulobacteraceae bacterium]